MVTKTAYLILRNNTWKWKSQEEIKELGPFLVHKPAKMICEDKNPDMVPPSTGLDQIRLWCPKTSNYFNVFFDKLISYSTRHTDRRYTGTEWAVYWEGVKKRLIQSGLAIAVPPLSQIYDARGLRWNEVFYEPHDDSTMLTKRALDRGPRRTLLIFLCALFAFAIHEVPCYSGKVSWKQKAQLGQTLTYGPSRTEQLANVSLAYSSEAHKTSARLLERYMAAPYLHAEHPLSHRTLTKLALADLFLLCGAAESTLREPLIAEVCRSLVIQLHESTNSCLLNKNTHSPCSVSSQSSNQQAPHHEDSRGCQLNTGTITVLSKRHQTTL